MFKKIFIYGIGIFFSKVIVFLLIPIYTRVFSPSDYGYYDVLISNISIIVSISFIEVWSGVIRFMFDNDSKYKPLKSVINMFPIFFIFYCILFFLLGKIMVVKFPILTFVYGISFFMFSLSTSSCRGLGRNVDYIVSGILSSLFGCTLSVVFVTVYNKGIEYLLISQIIGYFIACAFIEFRTHAILKAFSEKVNFKYSKKILKYCFPLLINSFSFIFLSTYNKNLVLSFVGETESGLYAYILKFTVILSVVLSIFSLAWQEFAFENAEDNNINDLYSDKINSYIRFVGLGVPIYIIVLYYFSPIFGGASFEVASKYIPLAVCASYIADLSGVISIIIAVSKKTLPILLSTVFGAIINVIITTLLMRNLGIMASNIGLLIGFGSIVAIRFYYANKTAKLNINFTIVYLFIIGIIAVNICYFVKSNILNIFVLSILCIIWFICNYKKIKNFIENLFLKIKGNKDGK